MVADARKRLNRALSILLVAAGAVFFSAPAESQSPARVPRIGYLDGGWPTPESQDLLNAFRLGLREFGYIEGRNIAIEYRWAEGDYERLPELAGELARLKVDIIVAGVAQAARAAKQATGSIPIVVVAAVDPVGFGLVKGLARPGENITGLSNLSPELTAKHLELLKETAPGISRVAVLWNAANPIEVRLWRARQAAARALGLTLISVEVRSSDDLAPALATMIKGRPEALHLFADPLLLGHRGEIIAFAAKYRLPIVSDASEFTTAGGLMSYGVHLPDLFRSAARYVDKILKGGRPSTLPVEQPTRFELVINLKTARTLGIAISPSVLVLADRVIE
jgi:putative ABC transport system substrate-binding protein